MYTNSNYTISRTTIAQKITNKLILNSIQQFINPILRNSQNGFRPGRSTTTHILALRRLIEELKANNLLSIISAISTLYENTHARVLTPDGETDFFKNTIQI